MTLVWGGRIVEGCDRQRAETLLERRKNRGRDGAMGKLIECNLWADGDRGDNHKTKPVVLQVLILCSWRCSAAAQRRKPGYWDCQQRRASPESLSLSLTHFARVFPRLLNTRPPVPLPLLCLPFSLLHPRRLALPSQIKSQARPTPTFFPSRLLPSLLFILTSYSLHSPLRPLPILDNYPVLHSLDLSPPVLPPTFTPFCCPYGSSNFEGDECPVVQPAPVVLAV